MATRTRQAGRRGIALSKDRIVDAAIVILDSGGEGALTFRALGASLQTGSGAIYWHVADKNELLAAAADRVVARVMAEAACGTEPRDAIRTIGLGMFDAIDAHPWVGGQLFREPWRPAMLQILDGVGTRLQALGVPERAQFNAATALVNYVLGVAGQNAANARSLAGTAGRAAFLATVAARWTQLDPDAYPFVRQMATRLREHDDREQFLAGMNLILAGLGTA